MQWIIIEINGYDDKWIKQRLNGVVDRHKLTDAWKENGITKNYEYVNEKKLISGKKTKKKK